MSRGPLFWPSNQPSHSTAHVALAGLSPHLSLPDARSGVTPGSPCQPHHVYILHHADHSRSCLAVWSFPATSLTRLQAPVGRAHICSALLRASGAPESTRHGAEPQEIPSGERKRVSGQWVRGGSGCCSDCPGIEVASTGRKKASGPLRILQGSGAVSLVLRALLFPRAAGAAWPALGR